MLKAYAAGGHANEAAAAYDKAIAAKTDFVDAYLDRANLYKEANQIDLSIEVLKKGMALIPGDHRLELMAASLLEGGGKIQGSARYVRRFVSARSRS